MSRHSPLAPSQALYRVFVAPCTYAQLPRRTPKDVLHVQQSRSYGFKRKPAPAPETRRERWNHDITADTIILVDEESGKLQPSVTKWDVLNRMDFATHRLVQLVAHDPKNPEAIPVCKIISKKEIVDAQKQRRINNRESNKQKVIEQSLKTIEVNWAIDENDLGHRLSRLKQFLEEGRKVALVLAAKKRGRVASPEECRDVVKKIRDTVDGINGASETKEMEGRVGGVAMLSYQGRVRANASETKTEQPADETKTQQPAEE